jgi:hypothetical protein
MDVKCGCSPEGGESGTKSDGVKSARGGDRNGAVRRDQHV